MMKTKKRFKKLLTVTVLTMFLLGMGATSALAHEVFFKLDADGEVGQEHKIDLLWGHFPDDIDPESAYFNAIPGGDLYVVTPTGERVDLELEQLSDRYQATFTPEVGGDHLVIFNHYRGVLDWTHGEPQGMQSIETAAKAFIDVHGDEDIEAWDQVAGLNLEIKALVDVGHLHTDEEMLGQLLYKGEPLANVEVQAVSVEEEVLELITDSDGKFSFIPQTEGPWMMKVAYFDDQITEVDGEDVIGARYTLTAFIDPHGHDDEGQDVAASGGDNFNYLYILAVALFAGAGFLFIKSNKK